MGGQLAGQGPGLEYPDCGGGQVSNTGHTLTVMVARAMLATSLRDGGEAFTVLEHPEVVKAGKEEGE